MPQNRQIASSCSKSESGFQREKILMISVTARHLFAALDGIFSFEDKILVPAITEPKTQTPDFGGGSAKQELAHVTVSDDREAFIDENLTEPSRAVKLAGNVVNAFHRVIEDVPPIDSSRIVVIEPRV